MQLRFFTLPVYCDEAVVEELNRFLTGNRILSIDRHFMQDGENSAWSICVCFESGGASRPQGGGEQVKRIASKVDYREVFNEQDFSVYAQLRALRKELAEREGVPAYALFTNEQMAEMIRRRVTSAMAMREIQGVGDERVKKYAEAFLRVLRECYIGTQQTGYASALAITAHTNAAAWRSEQLHRSPLDKSLVLL
jgi:superfamily II DNA helicase RecQ